MSELEARIKACKELIEKRGTWGGIGSNSSRVERLITTRDTLTKQHEAAEDALDTCPADEKDYYLAVCNHALNEIARIERQLATLLGVQS